MRRGILYGRAVLMLAVIMCAGLGTGTPARILATDALPAPGPAQARSDPPLPLIPDSVRFAVIGDNGTGGQGQYDVSSQMVKVRETLPYDFVIMLGDNIYGGVNPNSYVKKFEEPYKPLLDAGVKFYASLGNHDDPSERFYKPFNMGGQRYYSFKKGGVHFLALDSNYMDPQQLQWLESQLSDGGNHWTICYFHHPMYSDGRFHGPDLDLRARLEPLFEKYGVDVVFSGHDHVYERLKPQHGINYFVMGSAGELRPHDLHPSADMASGFDTDRAFMMVEIAGDELHYAAISRTGSVVDSGVVQRQKKPAKP